MKKIKLNLDNIQGAELLSREQLKKIVGGFFGTGGCSNPPSFCYDDNECCTEEQEKCVDGNCRKFLNLPCGIGEACPAGQHCVHVFVEAVDPLDPNDNGSYEPQCMY